MNGDFPKRESSLTEDPKLDPEIKAKWLAALRSGDYNQGFRALRPAEDAYCCLGVLCDVLDPDGWNGDVWTDPTCDDDRGEHDTEIPLMTESRLRFPKGAICTLMEMNDDHGKSFPEIADWIEANL